MLRVLALVIAIAFLTIPAGQSNAGKKDEPEVLNYAMIMDHDPIQFVVLFSDGTWKLTDDSEQLARYMSRMTDIDFEQMAERSMAWGELEIVRDTTLFDTAETGSRIIRTVGSEEKLLYEGFTGDYRFYKISDHAKVIGYVPWADAIPIIPSCGAEGSVTTKQQTALYREPDLQSERLLELEPNLKFILPCPDPTNGFYFLKVPNGPAGFVPFGDLIFTTF